MATANHANDSSSVFCNNDYLNVQKAPHGNRNRSLSDPVNNGFNKSVSPAVTTMEANNESSSHENNKYLLENFAIMEQVATLTYSKVFKVKRHTDNKLFFLKCTAQLFDGSDNDLRKSDVLMKEMTAFYKFRHNCLLKSEGCWLQVYNAKSVATSLDQPFDLFDLPPQNDDYCSTSSLNDNNGNNNNNNDGIYDSQAKSFLSAIFESTGAGNYNETSSSSVNCNETSCSSVVVEKSPSMVKKYRLSESYNENENIAVIFNLMEYIPLTLEEILTDKGFQLTEDDKWRIAFHLTTFFYYYHRHAHLHMQISPGHVLIDVDETTSTLTPKLMDYGVNVTVSSSNNGFDKNRLRDNRLPPEINSENPIDSSADVFCLGLLFLQIFAHPATYDFRSIYHQLIRGRTECLSQIVLPNDVVFLLEQMLTENPESRPEPSEILDYMVPFVDVDFPISPATVKPLISDIQHSDMLTQVVEIILYVELRVVEANLAFKQWLNKIPSTLWEAILQNRAKIDCERFLSDSCTARRIDFEFVLDKWITDNELSCTDNDSWAKKLLNLHRLPIVEKEDLLKLVIFLTHKRYCLDEAGENPDVTCLFERLCKIML